MKGNVKWDTEGRLAPQTICTSFVNAALSTEAGQYSRPQNQWMIHFKWSVIR